MSFFAETACDLGDVEGAHLCYRALAPCASYCNAGGAGAVVCRGTVATVLGRLAALLGRVAEAERHYAAGAALNRHIGAVPYLSETLLHWAELRARTDPARARTLAEEAGAIAGRLGMSASSLVPVKPCRIDFVSPASPPTLSPGASAKSPTSWPRGDPTGRSPSTSCSPSERWRPT
jgi:hypothetical protein